MNEGLEGELAALLAASATPDPLPLKSGAASNLPEQFTGGNKRNDIH
jgi:hypothetical protein